MNEKPYAELSLAEKVEAGLRFRKSQVPTVPVSVESVRAEVLAITDGQGDAEQAHSREDDLYEAVLRTIASMDESVSVSECIALAEAALATKALDFPRWCA